MESRNRERKREGRKEIRRDAWGENESAVENVRMGETDEERVSV